MSIAQHPAWCSAHECSAGPGDLDHRSAPMRWTSSCDDFLITTGLARLDETNPGGETQGRARVNLGLLDIASNNLDGTRRHLETDLTAQDARLLAAALITAAEQLESLQRKGAA